MQDTFFAGNDLLGRRIADPFMGGGTPLIEANRLGCDVQGFDVNPMAAWIVREEIDHLDLAAYGRAAGSLVDTLRGEIGPYYRTFCPRYGDAEVPVKSFLWVKTLACAGCGESIDLFPGYLLAANRRHPTNVLVCAACGDLNEAADRDDPGGCAACGRALRLTGPARRGRCDCPRCGHPNPYPGKSGRPLQHRLYTRMARALKPGAPLAFTFHHNKLEAYYAVGIAILDAGLVCSASLPCPAEMGGSIHIHGTGSSIIDTVFVCRATGTVPRRWLAGTSEEVAALVAKDVTLLEAAGRTPTRGDTRCMVFGHLTRMAAWNLRRSWDVNLSTAQKAATFAAAVAHMGAPEAIICSRASGRRVTGADSGRVNCRGRWCNPRARPAGGRGSGCRRRCRSGSRPDPGTVDQVTPRPRR